MTPAFANIRSRWAGLNLRQQRVVGGAGLVLAVGLLVAYVWLPLERSRTDLTRRLPELRAQLAAMQTGATEVARLRTLPAAPEAAAPRALDVTLLRGNFAGAQVTPADNGRFTVTVADTSFAQWMDELRRLNNVARIDEVRFTATGKGRVQVQATLTAAGRK